jgi:hypothetical protein
MNVYAKFTRDGSDHLDQFFAGFGSNPQPHSNQMVTKQEKGVAAFAATPWFSW